MSPLRDKLVEDYKFFVQKPAENIMRLATIVSEVDKKLSKDEAGNRFYLEVWGKWRESGRLGFGKCNGQTLPKVLLHDPSWFVLGSREQCFRKTPVVPRGGPRSGFQGSKYKIPRPNHEHWRVKYDFEYRDRPNGFRFVRETSGAAAQPDRLDFSVVHRHGRYVKSGYEFLLRDFRLHYFGDPNAELTREECENLFGNAANFFEPPELEEPPKLEEAPKPFGEEEEAEASRSHLRDILPA